jgi:hypothetical protein
MKIRYNTRIPLFPTFRAITLFGNLYIKGDRKVSESFLNHERIHSAQWKELFHIGFILWYCTEWLIRFLAYCIKWILKPQSKFYLKSAYKNISFEREAFENENDKYYHDKRKKYNFIKYL